MQWLTELYIHIACETYSSDVIEPCNNVAYFKGEQNSTLFFIISLIVFNQNDTQNLETCLDENLSEVEGYVEI